MTIRGVSISKEGAVVLSPKLLGGIATVVVTVIVVVVLFVAMSGKGSSVAVASQAAPQAATVPQEVSYPTNTGLAPDPAPVVAPPIRPANQHRFGSLLITVSNVQILQDELPPETHLRYATIQFTVQEVGSIGSRVDPSYFKLVDNDGVMYSDDYAKDKLKTTGLQPGEQTNGILYFKILKGTQPTFLDYASKNGETRGRIPLSQITK